MFAAHASAPLCMGLELSAPSPGDDLRLVSAIRSHSGSACSNLMFSLFSNDDALAVAMPLAIQKCANFGCLFLAAEIPGDCALRFKTSPAITVACRGVLRS